jgi:lipocalin
MVTVMESRYGKANRIWVMDRGIASEGNLQLLRQRGNSYIVGTPKAMLRQFEHYLMDRDWHEVQDGVQVKLVAAPGGEELYILTCSIDRRRKVRVMHECFIERRQVD